MMTYSRVLLTGLLTGLFLLGSWTGVQAQKEPDMPPPMKALVQSGAQMRYLGNFNGLNGWIAMQNGQEQFFYVTSDGQAILSGVLFDRNGDFVTANQMAALQAKNGDVLSTFQEKKIEKPTPSIQKAFKTPSEQLYTDMGEGNWITLGKKTAPIVYTFIDPQCPHCKSFISSLRHGYIDNGLVQIRVVPVGVKDESKAQAAFLLAAPNPEERFFRHLDGDKNALPISEGISVDGIDRNLSIMQAWKFDVTPLSVYRAKDGTIKIIQGPAKDIPAFVNDIAPAPPVAP